MAALLACLLGCLRIPFERGIVDLNGLEALDDRITIAAKARFRYLGGIKRMRP